MAITQFPFFSFCGKGKVNEKYAKKRNGFFLFCKNDHIPIEMKSSACNNPKNTTYRKKVFEPKKKYSDRTIIFLRFFLHWIEVNKRRQEGRSPPSFEVRNCLHCGYNIRPSPYTILTVTSRTQGDYVLYCWGLNWA